MSKIRYLLIVAFLLAFIPLLLCITVYVAKAQAIPGQEASTNPTGSAYELYSDERKYLWISDSRARQAWQVDPATGVYTIYKGLPYVSDARVDANGFVWWSDTMDNVVGRLSPNSGTVITWAMPGNGYIWGLTFDDTGRVWATDSNSAHIYAINQNTNQICTYIMPNDGISDYITMYDNAIWLGDWVNHRVVKLNLLHSTFTYWSLFEDAWPQGQVIDEASNLWWADEMRSVLARFDESSSRLSEYILPYGARPDMLASRDGLIWYTDSVSATVGSLDPTQASVTTTVLLSSTVNASSSCVSLGSGTGYVSTIITGTLSWSGAGYSEVFAGDGWEIYQLPYFASPWGITTYQDKLWVVDKGRKKLIQMPMHDTHVYVPSVLR